MESSSEEICPVQKSPDRIYMMFFIVLLHLQNLQIYIQVVPGSRALQTLPKWSSVLHNKRQVLSRTLLP